MTATAGDTVRIHYTGTLADGEVFDSSRERDPLEFTLGSGQVIPGFDDAVSGMSVGESKKVEIPPERAYGPVSEDARQTVPRTMMPDGMVPEVGMRLQLTTPTGQPIMVHVAEITDDSLVLDANHPLAGKALTFAIELMEIVGN